MLFSSIVVDQRRVPKRLVRSASIARRSC